MESDESAITRNVIETIQAGLIAVSAAAPMLRQALTLDLIATGATAVLAITAAGFVAAQALAVGVFAALQILALRNEDMLAYA